MKLPKELLGIGCLVVGIASSSNAFAVATLKTVEVAKDGEIHFSFDSKIRPGQIKTEYFGDVIQLSILDASVYPAKIIPIAKQDFTKIFAYQYAPKQIRCRISVKGNAEEARSRFKLDNLGKSLVARLQEEVDTAAAKNDVQVDEQKLLENVLKASPAATPKAEKEVPLAISQSSTHYGPSSGSAGAYAGRSSYGFFRMLAMLGLVIGLFLGFAILYKKLKGHKLPTAKFGKNPLSKFVSNLGFGLGSKEKWIEVIANHHLAPKKSIAVVKIAGRLMVIGVANESINLISQLPNKKIDTVDTDLFGAQTDEVASLDEEDLKDLGGDFSSMILQEGIKPSAGGPSASVVSNGNSGVRARIKSQMEKMKPL